MHRSKWHRYSITRSAGTRSPCGRRCDHDVTLIAFDLIELQDDDLRNLKFGRPQATSRQRCLLAPGTQSSSTSIWPMTARPCSNIAVSALKASSRSGSTRHTGADRRRFGLSRKTRSAKPCGAKVRKIGIDIPAFPRALGIGQIFDLSKRNRALSPSIWADSRDVS